MSIQYQRDGKVYHLVPVPKEEFSCDGCAFDVEGCERTLEDNRSCLTYIEAHWKLNSQD
jgi:hypothetical protein